MCQTDGDVDGTVQSQAASISLNSAVFTFSQEMLNVGKSQVKTRLDQRLLTKYLTKLPGLPSRLGSLRGSRVPAHLKKHKQSHVYTRPKTTVLHFSSLQFLKSMDTLYSLTNRFWRTAPLRPARWSHGNGGPVAARRTMVLSNYQNWRLRARPLHTTSP